MHACFHDVMTMTSNMVAMLAVNRRYTVAPLAVDGPELLGRAPLFAPLLLPVRNRLRRKTLHRIDIVYTSGAAGPPSTHERHFVIDATSSNTTEAHIVTQMWYGHNSVRRHRKATGMTTTAKIMRQERG